jgi:hypothetical protein
MFRQGIRAVITLLLLLLLWTSCLLRDSDLEGI